jgi:hypothetical protein
MGRSQKDRDSIKKSKIFSIIQTAVQLLLSLICGTKCTLAYRHCNKSMHASLDLPNLQAIKSLGSVTLEHQLQISKTTIATGCCVSTLLSPQ